MQEARKLQEVEAKVAQLTAEKEAAVKQLAPLRAAKLKADAVAKRVVELEAALAAATAAAADAAAAAETKLKEVSELLAGKDTEVATLRQKVLALAVVFLA